MMEESRIVELDVRAILREKKDPFDLIMKAVKGLKEEQELVLHALFKPTPLLKVMKLKGYESHVEQLAEDHFRTTFRKEKR